MAYEWNYFTFLFDLFDRIVKIYVVYQTEVLESFKPTFGFCFVGDSVLNDIEVYSTCTLN